MTPDLGQGSIQVTFLPDTRLVEQHARGQSECHLPSRVDFGTILRVPPTTAAVASSPKLLDRIRWYMRVKHYQTNQDISPIYFRVSINEQYESQG